MPEVARLGRLDSTMPLLLEGYRFISSRCERLATDAFETRVMGQRVVCMMGEEAARIFYGSGRFTRKKAIPRTTLTLLQDFGSAQLLDGDAHRHRKQMFMALMTPDGVSRLADLMATEWRAAVERWRGREVVLDDEAQEIVCRAVCAWAGVPLEEQHAREHAAELGAMFDGAGSFGYRQVRGQRLRRRGERWIKGVVEDIRAGRVPVPEGSGVQVITSHRDLDGQLLDIEVAAVEILNILRPTVAVSRYVTFLALALHQHPQWRERLRSAGDGELEMFVQEVRRTAPFFPLITGRVKEPFDWRGHRFGTGDWVMLDLYGTNHDARIWNRPDDFDPERFLNWDGNAFTLIPQGAGDFLQDHRCAGEPATVAMMKAALRLLTQETDYEVPDQNLKVWLSRMPARPKSGFVIRNARSQDRHVEFTA